MERVKMKVNRIENIVANGKQLIMSRNVDKIFNIYFPVMSNISFCNNVFQKSCAEDVSRYWKGFIKKEIQIFTFKSKNYSVKLIYCLFSIKAITRRKKRERKRNSIR